MNLATSGMRNASSRYIGLLEVNTLIADLFSRFIVKLCLTLLGTLDAFYL